MERQPATSKAQCFDRVKEKQFLVSIHVFNPHDMKGR